jgi:hypothetical protein
MDDNGQAAVHMRPSPVMGAKPHCNSCGPVVSSGGGCRTGNCGSGGGGCRTGNCQSNYGPSFPGSFYTSGASPMRPTTYNHFSNNGHAAGAPNSAYNFFRG